MHTMNNVRSILSICTSVFKSQNSCSLVLSSFKKGPYFSLEFQFISARKRELCCQNHFWCSQQGRKATFNLYPATVYCNLGAIFSVSSDNFFASQQHTFQILQTYIVFKTPISSSLSASTIFVSCCLCLNVSADRQILLGLMRAFDLSGQLLLNVCASDSLVRGEVNISSL